MEAAAVEVHDHLTAIVFPALEILEVAAEPDVIVEEAHHARTQIPAEHIVVRLHVGKCAAVNLRAEKADTSGPEGTDAAAVRPTDRNADDDVAHQVDDAVIAELRLGPEEARVPAEVELAAKSAGAHPARIHT